MKFGDELDKYTILKLPLSQYRPCACAIEAGFQIVGAQVRPRVRKEEKELLKLYFRGWRRPYYGILKGWTDDSPIYITHQGRLVSGLYLCKKNEYNEDRNWGQLHYFFTDPAFKKRRLHCILFQEAVNQAKSWNLEGVIISTDRYLLPEVSIRWGAIPWKEIRKVQPRKTPIALAKAFLRRVSNQFRS